MELVGHVNRSLNREMMEIAGGIRDVFESLEKASDATLHLVQRTGSFRWGGGAIWFCVDVQW